MTRLFRHATAVALLLALAAAAPPTQATNADKVSAVIARSKAPPTTYAAYFWNWIEQPGQAPVQEWSAEFHASTLHRVETPRDRVVADCAAPTGTYRQLDSGEIVRGPQVALIACGIATHNPFLHTEYLGRVTTRFGGADRVRLTDAELIKTYDISDGGVILTTTFVTNDDRRKTTLRLEAVDILDRLPDPAMFDETSLEKSYVPDRFKDAPGSVVRSP